MFVSGWIAISWRDTTSDSSGIILYDCNYIEILNKIKRFLKFSSNFKKRLGVFSVKWLRHLKVWTTIPRIVTKCSRSQRHRCSRRQKFRGAKVFSRNSPNLPEKFLCDFCPQILSHKDHEDLLLVWPPRKGLHVLLWKRWAPFFEIKQRWRHFCPDFQGFCPNFQRFARIFDKSNFWGSACTPAS